MSARPRLADLGLHNLESHERAAVYRLQDRLAAEERPYAAIEVQSLTLRRHGAKELCVVTAYNRLGDFVAEQVFELTPDRVSNAGIVSYRLQQQGGAQ